MSALENLTAQLAPLRAELAELTALADRTAAQLAQRRAELSELTSMADHTAAQIRMLTRLIALIEGSSTAPTRTVIARQSSQSEMARQVIMGKKGRFHPRDIIDGDITRNVVSHVVKGMLADGTIVRERNGTYRLA